MRLRHKKRAEEGFALIGALILVLILLALIAGLAILVDSEGRQSSSDAESNIAHYGAEAGLEKMAADLSGLYATRQSPTVAEIQALAAAPPVMAGLQYRAYNFNVPNVAGVPTAQVRNISSGPNEGLVAQIVPMTLTVETRRLASQADVRLQRTVEVALIPVFQFGVFSESDLSFFPGPSFDFAGRVHTNGNLFLASSNAAQGLKFHSRITAVNEVIRQELSNTLSTNASGRTANVMVPTASNGCDGAAIACRNLALDEGSKLGGPTSADNPGWSNISRNLYSGNIRNNKTGVRPLTLPFVSPGVGPVQIIRKPAVGEAANSALGQSRLFNQADLRVLLESSPANLAGGAGDAGNIRLANVVSGADYSTGVPVGGAANTYFAEGRTGQAGETGWVSPGGNRWPLIDGWIRVEARNAAGNYQAVTREWIELGFARGTNLPNSEFGQVNNVHPNAILLFQLPADRNANGVVPAAPNGANPGESTAVIGAGARNNWYPINVYDPREGEVRDVAGPNATSCAIGGIFNLVELDVRNLRRWLTGAIGATGAQTSSAPNNGYILYFSDRRGMLMPPGAVATNGEFGYEDVINSASGNGNPDGLLEPSEDVNEDNRFQTYGAANLGGGFGAANAFPTRVDCLAVGRKNRVSGARHALRIENGSLGNVPLTPAGAGGFTVASENPVYVLGNYNANNGGFGDPHAASAVIADAVTFLSNNWSDLRSHASATNQNNRNATTSYYRIAVAAGKNRSFQRPVGTGEDFGTDGGVHNFLRYIENWGGQTLNYRGSLVSLYYSQYAVGVFKCCNTVYNPPTRAYEFDIEFLDPAKLPPGTPRFRDIDSTTAFQDFTPQ